jgi:anti-sigma B factor antagonist
VRTLFLTLRPAGPWIDRPRTGIRLTVHNPGKTAGVAIVALPAEIDIANAEQVWRRLSAALAPGVEVVVADLSATTFCDASGIRALLRVRDQAAATRVGLRLAVPPGRVRNLLELLSLDRQLAMYPSASQAAAD